MQRSESKASGYSRGELALGVLTAVLLGPVVVIALIPLAFVVALLWPVLILPVVAAGSLESSASGPGSLESSASGPGSLEVAHASAG